MYCSDEEGVRLIQSGGAVHKKSENWKESDTGGVCYYYMLSVIKCYYSSTSVNIRIIGKQ